MEGQAIELLESQISRLENHPQSQPQLREHLEETKAQQAEPTSHRARSSDARQHDV
jgi:ferritin-like metal-binding protein YciE